MSSAALLHKRFQINVDFDVEGAMVKLLRGSRGATRRVLLILRRPCKHCSVSIPSGITCSSIREDRRGVARVAGGAKQVRYQSVEAELQRTLEGTDMERAAVVGELKEQQDEINRRILALEGAMTGYTWRTG